MVSVTVTAKNDAGSGSATSASVGLVTAASGGGGGGGGQRATCAPAAGQEMTDTVSHLCGFADTTNTGLPAGTRLYRVPQDITAPTPQTGYGWTSTGSYIILNAGACHERPVE